MARGHVPTAPGPALSRPPWLAAAIIAAVATGLACYPAWPGFMSYDSLLAYEQAVYGVQTALWPPLHTYLFMASRAVGADTWGVFVVQTFALLFGAFLAIHVLTPRRPLAWTLCLFFAGGLVYFPTLYGSLLVHWRDVATGGFALLGIGLWLAAAQARSHLVLALAVVAMSLAVGLRYNAFVLVAPAMLLMVWRPFLDRGPAWPARASAVVMLVAGLFACWASSQWRLPDGLALPNAQNIVATQEFDIIGVSACAGRNYLPAAVTNGQPITVAQIRRAYDPRHLLETLKPKPGVPRMLETAANGGVQAAWRDILTREPVCYLEHRTAVLVEQMGMARAEVFYPTHGGIDANRFGLRLASPEASRVAVGYVERHADEAWRRPWLLYALAAVLGLLALLAARSSAVLILALLAGAFGYPALLFLAGPAADARYIFPSNVLCLLIALIGLGLLAAPRGRGG